MKTAICFSGQARSTEYTHENINYLIQSNFEDYDIFAYIKKDDNACKFEKYFQPKLVVYGDDININEKYIQFDERCRGNVQVYLNMLYNRKMVNQIRKKYSEKNNIKYDCIIHSRLDVKYFFPIIQLSNLNMEYLYIPDFHCFPIVQGNGYNDRFAISNEKNMDIYFNLFDYVKKEKQKGFKTHGESSLYRYLSINKIPVIHVPVRFTRVREDGTEVDLKIGNSFDPFRRDIEWQI